MKILITLLFSLAFGFALATWSMNHDRKSAVAAGVAEYVLNFRTGQIEFHYIKPEPTPVATPVLTPLPTPPLPTPPPWPQ